jgi:hypothetical protein
MLLDYVTSLPEERINMNLWADGPKADDCGTSACLGGHATTLFPNEICLVKIGQLSHGSLGTHGIRHLLDNELEDSDALRRVFSLDEEEDEQGNHGEEEVDLLFSGGRTAEEAIHDLRDFIANNRRDKVLYKEDRD